MTKDFNVSVSMNQAAPVKTGVVLKQGDFGFDLKITVLDFTVTGTTPQIVFRKPMGAVESTDVTASGNVYTYTFKGTELDTPGKVFCDLKLKNSTTQRISTASFQFECIADTLDGLTEESSSYSDTIAQLMDACNSRISNLESTTTSYNSEHKYTYAFTDTTTTISQLIDNSFKGKKTHIYMSGKDEYFTYLQVAVLYEGDQSYTVIKTVSDDSPFDIDIPDCKYIRIILYRASGTSGSSTYTVYVDLLEYYAKNRIDLVQLEVDALQIEDININKTLNTITEESGGHIDKSTFIKVHGMLFNYQTGKINSQYNEKAYSVYFPCLPNQKYNIYKAVGEGRFQACWTKVVPDYNVDVYDATTNNTGDVINITTGAGAKYILIWYYYSDLETQSESYFYNSLSVNGEILSAYDAGGRKIIEENQAVLGGEFVEIIHQNKFKKLASAINTANGALNNSPSTTALLIYFPCKPLTRYAVSKKLDARFVVGWTTTEPNYGGSCSDYISSSNLGTIEITTGATATHLCVFYYLSTACTNSESDLLNSITVTEGNPDYVIVSKTGYYKTITSGVGAVKSGGSVIVMPGTYEEQIDAQTKEVNIIGLDKNKCILLDRTGMYLTPPLEISTGSVQNMTIIETGEQSTPSSPGSNPTLAYCIHVDFDSEEDGELLISNCILRCNKRAAIGSGVRNNFTFTIENCDIWSGVQEDTSNLARGALYVHAASSSLIPSSGYVPAKLILKNNIINCDDVPAICFEDYSSTVGLGYIVEAIGNMIYSKETGKTDACIVNTDSTVTPHEPKQFAFDSVITQDPRSFGNNVALLNA